MLNRMTQTNFIWYLHVLLFLHAMVIQERITKKEAKAGSNQMDEDPDLVMSDDEGSEFDYGDVLADGDL